MTIAVNNLYQHADGGFYCLLSDDAALKEPTSVGIWHDAVIYIGTDGKMRSTTQARWAGRFSPVAEYTGDDEQVLMMVRRANPGDTSFDFLRVFESWHESEMGITGHMLELAVAAAVEKYEWPRSFLEAPTRMMGATDDDPQSVEVTISTEDLQRVVQTYEIERVPIPHGFTFRITKA
jgi:hypothetical protein